MVIPLKYNLRSLLNRRISTALIVLGISLVVMIFVSMMAMAQSMKRVIVQTGFEDNVIIKNKSSEAVEFGLLPEETINIIKYLPGIKKNPQGLPLVSPELYNRKFIKVGEKGTVIWIRIRGVTPMAFEVYPNIKIIEGRRPQRGEVMIGKELPVKFGRELKVGEKIEVGRQEHTISGIFETQGTTYEGEIWMDKEDMKLDFDMKDISMVTVKLESPSLMNSFINEVNENARLPMADAVSEIEYYSALAGTATFVLVMGSIIAVLMAAGAIFGGMNIMYMSVAGRTREIGTLLALGFRPFQILVSFTIESLLIALVAGILGCLLSILVNGYSLDLFEVAFSIRITPEVMMQGLILSLFIGFFGGLFPARAAAKLKIVEALRYV